MKENELFSFIWTGPAGLIAPDSAFVGFRPAWLPVPKHPNGAMLLGHLSQDHLDQVGPPYLERMRTEDIATVAMEAFERVGGHDRG